MQPISLLDARNEIETIYAIEAQAVLEVVVWANLVVATRAEAGYQSAQLLNIEPEIPIWRVCQIRLHFLLK